MAVTIQKWGNSLGLRIPKAVAAKANLTEGAEVEIVARRNGIVVRAVEVPSLQELLSQIKPGSIPPVADWGKPVGREVW